MPHTSSSQREVAGFGASPPATTNTTSPTPTSRPVGSHHHSPSQSPAPAAVGTTSPPSPPYAVSSSITSFAMMCPPEAMAAISAIEATQSADIISKREGSRNKREMYYKKLSELAKEQRRIQAALVEMGEDGDHTPSSATPFGMSPFQMDSASNQLPSHHHHNLPIASAASTAVSCNNTPNNFALQTAQTDELLHRLGASLHDEPPISFPSRDPSNPNGGANRFLYQFADTYEGAPERNNQRGGAAARGGDVAELERSVETMVDQIVRGTPIMGPQHHHGPGSTPPFLNHAVLQRTSPQQQGGDRSSTTMPVSNTTLLNALLGTTAAATDESANDYHQIKVVTTTTATPHTTTPSHKPSHIINDDYIHEVPPPPISNHTSPQHQDDGNEKEGTDEANDAAAVALAAPPCRPFPYRSITVLALVMFNESLASTMLIPFIGLFVAHLENIPPDEAGYTSGFLVGSFMFGQVISGKYWGQFSDAYGRKPAMMIGLFLGAFFVTILGFSTSVYMAMAIRLVHGICFGNCLVAKSMIPEIIDERDQAKGFSVVSLTWSSGSMIGPAIGGFLYDPTRYFDDDTSVPLMGPDSIFAEHPALFPCVVCAAYSMVALTCVSYLLSETNVDAKPLPTVSQITRQVSGQAKRTWMKRTKSMASLSMTNGEGGDSHDFSRGLKDCDQRQGCAKSPTTTTPSPPSLTTNPPPEPQVQSPTGMDAGYTRYPEVAEEDLNTGDNTLLSRVGGSSAPSNTRRVEHGISKWVSAQVPPSAAAATTESTNAAIIDVTTTYPPSTPSLKRPSTIAFRCSTKTDEDGGDRSTAYNDDNDGRKSVVTIASTAAATTVAVPPTPTKKAAVQFGYKEAYINPATRMAILLYMFICFCEIAFLEILPLWAVASISSGGLGLRSDDVAIVVAIGSVSGLVANVIFPKVVQRFKGPLGLFPTAVLLYTIPSLIVPSLTRFLTIPGDYTAATSPTPSTMKILITIIVISIPRTFGEGWGFSIVFIMTARAAPKGAIGAMTGIAMSFGSALRCLAPLISAPLFAWSISTPNRVFPFDENFAFFIASLPMFCCIPIGKSLERYLERKEIEKEKEDEEEEELRSQKVLEGKIITDAQRKLPHLPSAATLSTTTDGGVGYLRTASQFDETDCCSGLGASPLFSRKTCTTLPPKDDTTVVVGAKHHNPYSTEDPRLDESLKELLPQHPSSVLSPRPPTPPLPSVMGSVVVGLELAT